MRALQRELTTACCTCNPLLPSGSSGAGGGRHSGLRKHCPESTKSHQRRAQRSIRLLRTYVDSGGGGGGGNGGRASITFNDGPDTPPWSQYSLFGITVVLALSSFQQPSEAVHTQSSEIPARLSASKEQTAVSPESSHASNIEDIFLGAEQISVRNALAGRTVLLTGITGFVGSLVLEQLLRTCPDVHKVYVIARNKHNVSGPERVQHMLHSHPLFHLVRAQICKGAASQDGGVRALQEAFSDRHSEQQLNCFPSVEALAGDMTLPGYGLGACEMQRLKEETEVVIHAAASISFDDHIHDAITHNYTATKNLAEMAGEMPNLKAFVHVSTAYVNGNQPKGSTVSEQMLPLSGEAADHASLVTQLQALPKAQAASQANDYMQQWRFPNTYCFSKHLAESLMASYHSTAFPVAIVRPSIIGGLAGSPLPGYVGNSAGSTGAALAIATGIAAWTCHQPSSVFDVVPGDLVSSTILAAAAAITQGHRRQKRPFIVHACTSSQNSLTTGQFFQHIQAYFTSQPPPFRAIVGAYPRYQGHNIVRSKQMLAARSALAEAKFLALCTALKAAGKERLANKLYAGWKAWQKYNSPALDFNLCFQTHNLQRLQQLLPDNEQQLFRMSWECKDWQRYMTTYMAGIRHGVLKQPTPADNAHHDFVPWPVRLSPEGTTSKSMDIKPSGA